MNLPQLSTFKLPLYIITAFLVAALWVGAGRILFGVFGWMAFISLFLMGPIIVGYGVALAMVVGFRRRKGTTYDRKGPFMVLLYVTLAALFMLGLSLPDGGDSADSGGSALSVLMGDKSGKAELATAGVIAGWSLFVTVLAGIAAFVAAFVEKTNMTNRKKPSDTLKKIT